MLHRPGCDLCWSQLKSCKWCSAITCPTWTLPEGGLAGYDADRYPLTFDKCCKGQIIFPVLAKCVFCSFRVFLMFPINNHHKRHLAQLHTPAQTKASGFSTFAFDTKPSQDHWRTVEHVTFCSWHHHWLLALPNILCLSVTKSVLTTILFFSLIIPSWFEGFVIRGDDFVTKQPVFGVARYVRTKTRRFFSFSFYFHDRQRSILNFRPLWPLGFNSTA